MLNNSWCRFVILVQLSVTICNSKLRVSDQEWNEMKKFSGGGGLFDYSVTPGPGLSKAKCKIKQKLANIVIMNLGQWS